MATSEPDDGEDLPTFSLVLEFLTPEKTKLKKREKEARKARVIVSRKTHLFETIHWKENC